MNQITLVCWYITIISLIFHLIITVAETILYYLFVMTEYVVMISLTSLPHITYYLKIFNLIITVTIELNIIINNTWPIIKNTYFGKILILPVTGLSIFCDYYNTLFAYFSQYLNSLINGVVKESDKIVKKIN